MAYETAKPDLNRVLRFDPRWLVGDPVPDWFTARLNPEGFRELASIQIEYQKALLAAQMKALDRLAKVQI